MRQMLVFIHISRPVDFVMRVYRRWINRPSSDRFVRFVRLSNEDEQAVNLVAKIGENRILCIQVKICEKCPAGWEYK